MAFFIPSSIQKRLLRYALSRVELLDTDALDLGSLDVALGRRSTIELKDIAFRHDKLASVLHLPSKLTLESAKVKKLRLVVPADLHASSIIVHLSAIEISLKIAADNTTTDKHKTRKCGPSTAKAPATPEQGKKRHVRSYFQDREDYDSDSESEDDKIIPSPGELAKSFLAEELETGKEELETALASQSIDLQQSVLSSDDGDVDLQTGLGVELALPSFLAAFLKGVGDRLQINVGDVLVRLDADLDLSGSDGTRLPNPPTFAASTFFLHVDKIDLEGTQKLTPDTLRGNFSPHEYPSSRRCIILNGVTLSVSSLSSEFAHQSRSLDRELSSRSVNLDNSAMEREKLVQPSQSIFHSSVGDDASSEMSTTGGEGISSSILHRSAEIEARSSVLSSMSETYHQERDVGDVAHFDQSSADRDEESMLQSSGVVTESMQLPTGESDYFDGLNIAGSYTSHLMRSKISDAPSLDQREELSSRLVISSYDEPVSHPLDSFIQREDRDISPSIRIPGRFRRDSSVDRYSSRSMWHSTEQQSLDETSAIVPPNVDEDLAESRIFSHDEAESIYASALYGPETNSLELSKPEVDSSNVVPGSWEPAQDTAGSEEEEINNRPDIDDLPGNVDRETPSTPLPTSESVLAEALEAGSPTDGGDDAFDAQSPPEAKEDSSCPDCVASGKELLNIDKIEITILSLPEKDEDFEQAEQSLQPAQASHYMERSTDIQMPGTFSLYAQSTASLRRSDIPRNASSPITQSSAAREQSKSSAKQGPVNVVIGSVNIRADLSIARLLLQFYKAIKEILGPEQAGNVGLKDRPGKTIHNQSERPAFSLAVEDIQLSIAEYVRETTLFDSLSKSHSESTKTCNVLFRARVDDLNFRTKSLESLSDAALEIKSLVLGFSDENIVSFNDDIRMRTSVRDMTESIGKDVTLKFSQVDSVSDILVSTKPMRINLDVQKLDRTLESLGGLSGLIELGSSITSEATITGSSNRAQTRSRAVHFEKPAQTLIEAQKPLQHRINARIAGILLTVKGESCSVRYSTSAVKLVARPSHLRVQIDDMVLTGPYRRQTDINLAINLRLRDTRFTFLHTPEEHDLTQLISLLTPSKDKFHDDDDLLLDTLLRQRRKGSVLRITTSNCDLGLKEIESLNDLQTFCTELSRLSAVTKYLPEESRPGLMTLAKVRNTRVEVRLSDKIDAISLTLGDIDLAHIGGPFLIAMAAKHIAFGIGENRPVVTPVVDQDSSQQPPMIMIRMLGDDLQPTLKLKLWNVCLEYSVALAITLSELQKSRVDKTGSRATEFISLGQASPIIHIPTRSSTNSSSSSNSNDKSSLNVDVTFRDCALGLAPLSLTSKAVLVLIDTSLTGTLPTKDGLDMKLIVRKGSVLLIDDTAKLISSEDTAIDERTGAAAKPMDTLVALCNRGFVTVSEISAAEARIKTYPLKEHDIEVLDIDFKDELFVLESCADSTQTLFETLGALTPPKPPSTGQKYRTEVGPVEDMMASFTGDAFAIRQPRLPHSFEDDDPGTLYEDAIIEDDDVESGIQDDIGYRQNEIDEDMDDYKSSRLFSAIDDSEDLKTRSLQLAEEFDGAVKPGVMPSQNQGLANKWDSTRNRYVPVSEVELMDCPLKVRIHDLHVIWHLYDGFDWQRTRETITRAVQDVEAKATQRREKYQAALEAEDEESVIGDFLFNSIYIGVPIKQDPRELSRQINHNIDDLASETTSYASSATSKSHHTPTRSRSRGHKLRLDRSKRHKIAFELRDVSADIYSFQPGDETQNSYDIRVQDFEIFDHVPTSTWKKFATYMQDAGPREERKPMVHLEICDVRPVPELIATELVIRVTVLPLRLHVDQDALDFITRFFDFKDDSQSNKGGVSEQPYLQRVEVRPVPVKLDYKPKTVDYAGLRSGRTTEFMNFFILDGAEMVMKHAIIYGTSGFNKLHRSLEDVWMPDIKKNQLPGVLSGLNGVRTLVNVGTGVRDLIVIPIQEYKKDGRLVRSISKGAMAFAKQTGSELTRFGAKLAIGAQNALQGAEGYLVKPGRRDGDDEAWDADELDSEEKRAISHYANQPTGILQGLKGAARSLERDLLVTKDIIIAISGEMRESSSPEGAARAVARNAPTLVLRPMIGASKAISQTLMGVTNTVDPENRRRMEDKYKRY